MISDIFLVISKKNLELKEKGHLLFLVYIYLFCNYNNFLLAPDFAFVMGGKDSTDFLKFVDLCGRAYNILRKHSTLFINLFAMVK